MSDLLRFHRAVRFVHWCHAALFLALVATAALMIWSPPTRAVALGPYRVLPLVHELLGVAFLATPLLPALRRRGQALRRDLRELFRWRLADLWWLVAAPFSLVFRRLPLPDQPKFNAGQRLNGAFTLFSMVLLGLTGVIIWLGRLVPYWIQEPAYELHVWIALLSVSAFLAHVAMAVTHPSSLRAIVAGKMRRDVARRKYRLWVDDLERGA